MTFYWIFISLCLGGITIFVKNASVISVWEKNTVVLFLQCVINITRFIQKIMILFDHCCQICKLYFSNKHCFEQHYYNKIFKNKSEGYAKLSPCSYFKYCENCEKIAIKFFYENGKYHVYNSTKEYCSHHQKYAQKPHYCYMKPLDPP